MEQGITNKYIAITYLDFDTNIQIYMKSKLGISIEDVDNDLITLLINLFEIDNSPPIGEVADWIKEKKKLIIDNGEN